MEAAALSFYNKPVSLVREEKGREL